MLHPSCPDAALVFCIEHFQNWDTTLRHKVSLEKCGMVCNLVSFQVQAFQSSAADKAHLLFVCHNWRLSLVYYIVEQLLQYYLHVFHGKLYKYYKYRDICLYKSILSHSAFVISKS